MKKTEKKMGRPTDDPKSLSTRIRMSDTEIQMLNYCCEIIGITKAEVIRRGIKELYEKTQKEE